MCLFWLMVGRDDFWPDEWVCALETWRWEQKWTGEVERFNEAWLGSKDLSASESFTLSAAWGTCDPVYTKSTQFCADFEVKSNDRK